MDNSKQENSEIKLTRIKPYKTLQKNFAKLGITPKLLTQTYSFDIKMLVPFLVLIIGVSFVVVYICNYAESFVVYTEGIFMGSAGAAMAFLLMFLIIKVNELFEFINSSEEMLNKSKISSSLT